MTGTRVKSYFITFPFRVEWKSISTSGNDMNLDDLSAIKSNDPQDMLAHILALPDQLDQAWQLGFQPDLPSGEGIQQVLIAGMGGSAIGADLLEAYTRPFCRVPVSRAPRLWPAGLGGRRSYPGDRLLPLGQYRGDTLGFQRSARTRLPADGSLHGRHPQRASPGCRCTRAAVRASSANRGQPSVFPSVCCWQLSPAWG